MKKIILIILIILIIGGFYIVKGFTATAIIISNQRSEELSNVKIETKDNIVEVGTIPPNESKTIILHNKFGESGIKMIYNDGKVWQGGYIENGYKVRIIYSDPGIEYEYISIQRFLLGM